MPTSGQILHREETWYSGKKTLVLIKIYVNHKSLKGKDCISSFSFNKVF